MKLYKKTIPKLLKPKFQSLSSTINEKDCSSIFDIQNIELSEDQASAYNLLLRWAASGTALATLGGYAGTGKTTLVARLAADLGREGRRIAFVAPTGKAASVLKRKMRTLGRPEPVGTVHGLLYTPVVDRYERLRGWRRKLPEEVAEDYDLLIVDEASMLDRTLEADLAATQLPILAVGDHGQLPPVSGVSSWMHAPMIRLERIHRQAEGNPLIQLAHWVRTHEKLPSREKLADQFGVKTWELRSDAFAAHLQDVYAREGFEETVLLTYTNKLRSELNRSIQEHFFGSLELKKGTRVLCLKNLYDHQLINGTRGIVQEDAESKWPWWIATVDIPDENTRFSGAMLAAQFGRSPTVEGTDDAEILLEAEVTGMHQLGALFDYGYALTVHKSQGSEFKEVFVVLDLQRPRAFGRWLYTAVTRASGHLAIAETW